MSTSQIKLVRTAAATAYRLGNGKHPSLMHLHTPALDIVLSPQNQLGLTVDKSFSLVQVVNLLQLTGIRFVVVTGDDQQVVGILNAADALGEKPMKLVHERGVRHVDISVSDIMVPIAEMHVIRCTDARKMIVKDIVEQLGAADKSWAIAVSGEDPVQRIEGVFFAPDIVRHLDPVATWAPARRSFAAIEQAISH